MRSPPENPTEVECAKVIARRYGDGTVYLPAGTPRALFYVCIQRGLISDIDESAFAKKGEASAGVARQWNGRLGKVENSQVGVFAALAKETAVSLIDARLYLPSVGSTIRRDSMR
jgi:hypothetical protein